jgi:hypothetical protein
MGIEIKESGEANQYTLIKGNKWLMHIKYNGEFTVKQQKEDLQKFVDFMNNSN